MDIDWKTEDKPTPVRSVRPPNSISGWKTEIAGYYETMQEFIYTDAITVFQNLSQFSARASEMRSLISFSPGREETSFRTKIIDPFIEECDRQFKIHSRIQAINEMDAKLAGGRFA